MAYQILLIVFLLSFPFLVMWAETKSKVIRWMSPIIVCYLVGIGIGNIPGLSLNMDVLEDTTMVAVVLAIPLLLFSVNLPVLLKQVRPALFSFFLGICGVVVCAMLAYLFFRDRVSDPHAVSGMMIGVYTGGTQNMSAIGMGLDVDPETFVLLNSADIIFSGVYFLLLLTVLKRILAGILPAYKSGKSGSSNAVSEKASQEKPGNLKQKLAGLLLSFALVGIAGGSSILIFGELVESLVIIIITTLAIAASFVPRVRTLPGTFNTANYMLLVFALAMGSMANMAELLASSSALFWFCGFMVFGSILLHYLLAIIFRVDRDTLIITSIAAIFGPPFIAPVAQAIGNREIIPIGIALGLLGIAIGNYLGLGIAIILK